MIRRLKPYAKVSDSGVRWLGEIPSHWCVRRLRALVDIRTGARDTIEQRVEGKYPFFVRSQNVARIDTWSFDGEAVLTAGDGDVGKVFHYIDGRFDYHQRVYKLSDFNGVQGKFFFHYFRAMFGHEVFQGTAKSTVESLRLPMLQNFPVAVPSATEQATIAFFLDHVTERIDRYIRAKEKLIALLEEQKRATIWVAVSGRIDVRTDEPYSDYKPSGLDWLGDVPAHWDLRRTKALFRLRTEFSGVAHGRELLSVYSHIGVRPRKDLGKKGNKASTTDDYWIVRRGDLIANKLLAWMGGIGASHYDGVTSPAYDILMPVVDLVSDYYHFLFRTRTYQQQFKRRSKGIMDMRLRLYFDQFGQIPVVVPRVEEQQAIVGYLHQALSTLDNALRKTRRQIESVLEYRNRLITDVVTGKLDARQAAADLDERPFTDGIGESKDGAVQNSRGTHGGVATEATS